MSNWYNKNFRKSKAIKVLLHYPDHRIVTHYVIPKGDYITIGNASFVIDKLKVYYDEKRFPTLLYKYDDIEPNNPFDVLDKTTKPVKTPNDLYTQSESKLAQEFIRGMGGGIDFNMIILIALGVIVFAMAFGFYTLYNELKDVQEVLRGNING